jgi:hypothetical protein
MFYRLFLTVLYNRIYIQSMNLAFVVTKAKINFIVSVIDILLYLISYITH